MESVYYGELLGKEEIIQLGLLLTEYEENRINYIQFEARMKELGYQLTVKTIDSSKLKLLRDAESLEDRVKNKTIEPRDVHRYFATNDSVGTISFVYDRLMIDTLAEFGDKRAIGVRENLLRFERRFTRNVSPKKGK